MNRTPPPQTQVVEADYSADFDDDEDFRDYFNLEFDPLPSESQVAFRLRFAFASAGYRVARVENAPTHASLIVRAIRSTAPKITAPMQLARHFQGLLKRAGFKLRRDELTVGRNADRIFLAFLWRDSPVDYAAGLRQAEEDAAEFVNMEP